MKQEAKRAAHIKKLSKTGVFYSIAKKLEDRDDLFPQKTEEAKQFLRKIKGAKVY